MRLLPLFRSTLIAERLFNMKVTFKRLKIGKKKKYLRSPHYANLLDYSLVACDQTTFFETRVLTSIRSKSRTRSPPHITVVCSPQ